MLGMRGVGFALAMLISRCLCQFRLRWVANANMVSGGIWALFNIFKTSLNVLVGSNLTINIPTVFYIPCSQQKKANSCELVLIQKSCNSLMQIA